MNWYEHSECMYRIEILSFEGHNNRWKCKRATKTQIVFRVSYVREESLGALEMMTHSLFFQWNYTIFRTNSKINGSNSMFLLYSFWHKISKTISSASFNSKAWNCWHCCWKSDCLTKSMHEISMKMNAALAQSIRQF